jgi:hypothetical protein
LKKPRVPVPVQPADDAAWIKSIWPAKTQEWFCRYWTIDLPTLLNMCLSAARAERPAMRIDIHDGVPPVPDTFPPELIELCLQMPLELWAHVAQNHASDIPARLAGLILKSAKTLAGETY